jgi:hypothetical protein
MSTSITLYLGDSVSHSPNFQPSKKKETFIKKITPTKSLDSMEKKIISKENYST